MKEKPSQVCLLTRAKQFLLFLQLLRCVPFSSEIGIRSESQRAALPCFLSVHVNVLTQVCSCCCFSSESHFMNPSSISRGFCGVLMELKSKCSSSFSPSPSVSLSLPLSLSLALSRLLISHPCCPECNLSLLFFHCHP